MAAKAGDALPSVTLYEGTPANKVVITDLFKGKKGIIFGVPGAFTPGCSKTHLPGYVADHDKIQAAGADVVVCLATNDPFVMEAWGQAHNATGKVRMLSDMNCELTKALGLTMDALGSVRCKRFSAVIKDNTIVHMNVEEPGQMACSLSNPTLDQLKTL